jgi:hypothetical protein
MNKSFLFCFFLFIFILLSCGKKSIDTNQSAESILLKEKGNTTKYKTENEEVLKGLPEIGKWMFDSNLVPSSWLGKKLGNKMFREPINIIIEDSISKSSDEAKNNLMKAFIKAGYDDRWGHSSGYKGLIDSAYCNQFPAEYFHAFSDNPFELNNNHGRIFGPYFKNGVYYFTGALSRESGYYHHYISFTQARDNLTASLDSKTGYKLMNKIWLDNAIDNDSLTTGDHDGYAILIKAVK